MTNRPEILDKSVMMSSVIPSLKYSCFGSSLIFTKGRTAMEGLSGRGKAIFSLEATSIFGAGGTVGFEAFSGDGGVTFSLSAGSTEGAGEVGTVTGGFSDGGTVSFSLVATSG